jgi:putative transposase
MPNKHYDTDLSDAAWALVAPLLPAARPGGRPRSTDIRAVVNAIFYLIRTGCQWRLLPGEFPAWGTVYHYFRTWKTMGVWTCLQREIYEQTRMAAGRDPCPSVVIMDGQSVKTTERGGVRGFDGHKRVKGRKRHILVDTLGLMIANRVEPANMSDRRAADRLLGGLSPLFPKIHTVMADAGHQSRKLARELMHVAGWQLRITKRGQRAFQVTGLTWIVERTFAWLGRNRRFSKDYEYWVHTSETLLDIAATRLMLNRLAPA